MSSRTIKEPSRQEALDLNVLAEALEKAGANQEDVLKVSLEGFEGPLDILLVLAKSQKVNLRDISMCALAEQYLVFIKAAKNLRLELAADYIVMAAWLAYLKSKLLLPQEAKKEGEPSAEDLAAHLAWHLERLEAFREVTAKLFQLPQKGIDFFARGCPEVIELKKKPRYDVTMYALLTAYGDYKTRAHKTPLTIKPPQVYALEDALRRLSSMLGTSLEWQTLQTFLPSGLLEGEIDTLHVRSAWASTLAACLEMARHGTIEIVQNETFGPIYIRKGPAAEPSPLP